MSDAEILRRVAQLAELHLGWSGPVTLELDLIEDMRLDSLKLLTLAVQVENSFEICLDPEDESEIRTVADLVAAIADKLDGREPRRGGEV